MTELPENERDVFVRRARNYLTMAEKAWTDGNGAAHVTALAALSAAYSNLAMVVPDPAPEGLSELLKARIEHHRRKFESGT